MPSFSKIYPCLWFDSQAEEAANFYVAIFPDSKITQITRYSEVGKEFHQKPVGSVLTVMFELAGQTFTILNGGKMFVLNEAMSLTVDCGDQAEVDYYWEKLGAGGDPNAQQCGWLKDKFGLSWQIVPSILDEMMQDEDPERVARITEAFLKMKKFDVVALHEAYNKK